MGRHKGIKCSCWHTSWRKSNLYWHKVWKRGKWNVYYLHNLKDSVPSEVVNVSVSQFLETGQGHPKEVTLFVLYVKLLWDKILPCHIFFASFSLQHIYSEKNCALSHVWGLKVLKLCSALLGQSTTVNSCDPGNWGRRKWRESKVRANSTCH